MFQNSRCCSINPARIAFVQKTAIVTIGGVPRTLRIISKKSDDVGHPRRPVVVLISDLKLTGCFANIFLRPGGQHIGSNLLLCLAISYAFSLFVIPHTSS